MSKKPSWIIYDNINLSFRPGEEWNVIWDNRSVTHSEFITDPNDKLVGMDLPWKA